MDAKTITGLSKFLSFVLRHQPGAIGLKLDGAGWVEIDELVARGQAHGKPLTREVVAEIVATNAKQRFAISDDGLRIRASQGHSVVVDLEYAPAQPPEVLFHGTVAASLAAIRAEGLRRMGRQHVHLSPDAETARGVGGRRGKPVVLRVAAGRMWRDGLVFYVSANGVWLTEHVPAEYVEGGG